MRGGSGLKRIFALLLSFIMLYACALARAEDNGFYRMDRDSREAWKGQIANLRLLTRGQYKFGKAKSRYRIDPNYTPSTEGLDGLNISGSAQFSEPQFHQLAKTLRKLAKGKRVYVIDLRQESHVFLNGNPISWYSEHNWANAGLTLSQIQQDEAERFGTLMGRTIDVYGVAHDMKNGHTRITVRSCVMEQTAVEDEGFRYLRLPAPDLSWPPAALIDEFIGFVKGIDMAQTWLHFHCHAGKGRTAIFMAIYDMMQNPDVAFEDVLLRQAMTGGSYLPYADPESDIAEVYAKRTKRIRQIYDYLQEMNGSYTTPWSEWIANQEAGQ
jgi:hypothetical protein